MKYKLLGLQLLGVLVLMQSALQAMYSATPAAYRSFGGARFQAPATPTSSLNREGGWGSRLEYLMNPQANPYNPQTQIPRATLKPEIVKSIANRPVSAVTSWVSPESAVTPWVSMNSATMPYQNYNQMALFTPAQDFVQTFFEQLNELDALYAAVDILKSEEYHLKRHEFLNGKLNELNMLHDQLDENDIQGRSSVLKMQNWLIAALENEDFILKNLPKMKERAENRKRLEKEFAQDRLNREAQELDEEVGRGIPVENPYAKVKQDFKNQFTRGAKIGAVGAGTLYGLQKYKKANNQ